MRALSNSSGGWRRRAIILCLCTFLAGCPGLHDRHAGEPEWRFKGKLGYRTPGGSGSVLIDWRQYPRERFDVVLRAALGVALARVAGAVGGPVTLEQRGAKVAFADPDAAATQALGVPVPLGALRHWIRGVPAPWAFTATESGWRQSGWNVQARRQEDGLPARVVMRREDVRFVLAVREWR